MILKIKYTALLSILFFLAAEQVNSQTAVKRSGNGNRIYIGPVIGMYSINKNHAINPSQKMSAVFGFKREQKLGRDFKTFFLIGVEYFFHGLNFRSYYFTPDTIKLYDKSFSYNYSLFIHELNLPVQVKYLFRRADNSLFSPYITAAYHVRYLLPAMLEVKQDGALILKDDPELVFRTPFLNERLNAWVSCGLGWQKNSLRSSKGSFFAELTFRYGFSPYYFTSDYAASSLYIKAMHINLQLGLKF